MKKETALFSASRFLRSFVMLALSVTAPFYLIHLGLDYIETGIVLFASSLSSTAAIRYYPKLRAQNRIIVILYSGVFAAAILFMLLFQNLPAFIAALVFGGISLSGKDMTPNQPIEQYAIGSTIEDQREKNTAYTFYNFMAYSGNMVGAIFLFIESGSEFTIIFEFSFVFAAVSIVPYLFASFPNHERSPAQIVLDPETRKLTRELSALFATDSFAGGLVTTSVLSLWFNVVYSTSLQENGLIFFIVSLITALSILYSGSISTRMGLVRTMVYTHLISNAFLILMPVIHSLIYSEAFLFIRQATSQMDVSPRDSLINTIIDKDMRIRTNSVFLASRNIAQIPSPALGGILLDLFPPSLLYSAGLIKASYDIVLYIRFKRFKM